MVSPWASCQTFVPSGVSPETFEPLPAQVQSLEKAQVYITIGLPFEDQWLDRMQRLFPHLRVLDLGASFEDRGPDPHLWMSPLTLMFLAHQASGFLQAFYPDQQAKIVANTSKVSQNLKTLDQRLTHVRQQRPNVHFASYHPAWQALAVDYGFTEHSLFGEGKEPGPKELQTFSRAIQKHGIRHLFIPLEYNRPAIVGLSKRLNLNPMFVDVLSQNYLQPVEHFVSFVEQAP